MAENPLTVIDLLKALVDLPVELLRESCRVNPDAEVTTEGCDCWGDVAWVRVGEDGTVEFLREVPRPRVSRPPLTWFTREGQKVSARHPDAFVEITDDWARYFQTGQWVPGQRP